MADEQLNPYASPQNLEANVAAAKPGVAAFVRPYVSASGKAKWTNGLTIAALVLQVILLISCGLQLQMLYGAQAGAGLDQDIASRNDARQLAVSVATGMAEVAAFIALLFWVYASHANLPALGTTHLDFTNGWAVGWFFVPLANLYKPQQVVSEIWVGSDPASLQGKAPTGATLVGWWWCWRVLSAIVECVATAFEKETKSIEGFIGLTWFIVGLTVVLGIPMLVLQVLVVCKVQRFQDDRHTLLASRYTPGDFRDPLAATSQ
jgi:hypothetical protein